MKKANINHYSKQNTSPDYKITCNIQKIMSSAITAFVMHKVGMQIFMCKYEFPFFYRKVSGRIVDCQHLKQ